MVAIVNMIGQKQCWQQESTGLASGASPGLSPTLPSRVWAWALPGRGCVVLTISSGSPASSSPLVPGQGGWVGGAWELPLLSPLRVKLWILLWRLWVLFSLSVCEGSPQC